ncbi:MAG: GNAT family N-acetyltransferase [Sphingomicrobium sp.]
MACDQSENEWAVTEGEHDRDDVRALLAHHFAEMRADSPPEACHVLPADRLAEPGLRLFLLRDGDGRLLGLAALKQIGPGHGEVKSMRTAPNALGRGVGRALLTALIEEATATGMTRLSLETGNSILFGAANRVYLGHGFERCGPFGGYRPTEFTHFYSKSI